MGPASHACWGVPHTRGLAGADWTGRAGPGGLDRAGWTGRRAAAPCSPGGGVRPTLGWMAMSSPSNSVLRTKPVEDVLAQADDAGTEAGGEVTHLRRRLGAVDLMGFGIGIVIGTGIFTLTGIEAKNHAGPGVVFSFAIAGLVSLLAALCYAEMAAAVPTRSEERRVGKECRYRGWA